MPSRLGPARVAPPPPPRPVTRADLQTLKDEIVAAVREALADAVVVSDQRLRSMVHDHGRRIADLEGVRQ